MSSSPHPLESLLGPLRYACARDFANLKAVKDLGTPLRAAMARAQGLISAPRLAQLEAEVPSIDASNETQRRASVLRVIAALNAEGLHVPGLEGQVETPRTQAVETATASPPATKPPAFKPPPRPPPKTKRTKLEQKTKSEDEVRMLSIAPSSGPLARPLKEVGWRINPRLVGLLNKKQVTKVGDVLFLLPRVYEDRRELKKIAQLRAGLRGTVVVEVKHVEEGYGARRTFRAVLADSSGSIAATYFQTGPWLKAKFPIGKRLVVSGEVRQSTYGWEMPHPEVEPAEDLETSSIHFNRIVPVYPGFERHEQRQLRELAFKVSEKFAAEIDEPLPVSLRERVKLMGLSEALKTIHFPPAGSSLEQLDLHLSPAHQRLAFDELFFLQLALALRRQGVKVQPGIVFSVTEEVVRKAKGVLPFTLTGAQNRVIEQVGLDMVRGEPMNRLVQGDVGSGKTAVAIIAAAIAVQSGYQVAVMAPTELLAEQHHRTFSRMLAGLGIDVALVTGTGTAKTKRAQREAVASGRVGVAVGTHALIEADVSFAKLGLVVIDEQHRFGVIQRHALMAKGVRPDVLVMTATPIPRTLAMTLYGDLDVSVIDELPPGRTPIVTSVFNEKARARAYQVVQRELDLGHQAYVVYPLVEESEKIDLADATQGAAQLATIFPTARIGLLHGRMKADEKDAVMSAFRAHEVDMLVCTTVVEVGVDVPNASVMVIEHSERFGLSQLHQLRGRVGRGAAKSHCVLLAGYALSEEGRNRLAVMEQSTDGFVIAERDLEIRGPGEFLGTRQSGLPELAVANLVRDQALLAQAQLEARAVVEADPTLVKPEHASLVKALEERWEGRLKLARVG